MEYLDGLSLEELVQKAGPAAGVARGARAAAGVRLAQGGARPRPGAPRREAAQPDALPPRRRARRREGARLRPGEGARRTRTRATSRSSRACWARRSTWRPERLRNPADADARADIYALGAVAFFLLTGRRVFETQSDHDLVYQVLNVPAPSIAAVRRGGCAAGARRPSWRAASPRSARRGRRRSRRWRPCSPRWRGSGRGARRRRATGGRLRPAPRRRAGAGSRHGRAHMTAPSRAQPWRAISRQVESLVV